MCSWQRAFYTTEASLVDTSIPESHPELYCSVKAVRLKAVRVKAVRLKAVRWDEYVCVRAT